MKHPLQHFQRNDGYPRFVQNKIVDFLADSYGLNDLVVKFSGEEYKEDWEQLAQLIGYSLSGFSELNYVSDDTFKAAELKAEGQDEIHARINSLEKTLKNIREKSRALFPEIFQIHPDDLVS